MSDLDALEMELTRLRLSAANDDADRSAARLAAIEKVVLDNEAPAHERIAYLAELLGQ